MAHSSDGVVAAVGGDAEIYTVGWLRLSPAPPIEIGAEGPVPAASEDDDGQDEDVELHVARGAEPERRSVAVAVLEPAPLCGDSNFISI